MKRLENALCKVAKKKARAPPRPKINRAKRQIRVNHSERPDPLPEERGRSLTPFTADNEHDGPNTYHQGTSIFFSRIPIEIRILIYRAVLVPPDEQELHVCSSHKQLLSLRCYEEPDPNLRGWMHNCWGSTATDGTTVNWREEGLGHDQEEHKPAIVMGLLCSCRRVYSECINILYSENTFNFRQTRTIVDFKATILPQRLLFVHSIHLDCPLETSWSEKWGLDTEETYWPWDVPFFWEFAWQVIADMKGLQSLRVSLSRTNPPKNTLDQKSLIHLFRWMVLVKVPRFKVEFYWPVELEEVLQYFEGHLPFSIEVKKAVYLPG